LSKLHHSFTGTLSNAIANDLCVENMEIGGILVNATTFSVYVRTKKSTPSVVGDWSLFTGSSGGVISDKFVNGLLFSPTTNILSVLRSDGITFTTDLSSLKVPVASVITFNNAGTNFISTTVDAAIKELNTSRPWVKVGTLQSSATTNKPVLVGDNIYHLGKVVLGTFISDAASALLVNGSVVTGKDNSINTNGSVTSAIIGGYENTITYTNDPGSGDDLTYGSQILGGRGVDIDGHRILAFANSNMAITGSKHFAIQNETMPITGQNNFVAYGSVGRVDGNNNTVFRVTGVNILGSNNTIFYMPSTVEFSNSNTNVILYAQNVEKITNANKNIILKAVNGSVRASDNLVWGENLHLLSGLDRSDNVVLGRNIYVGGNNNFIWSATQNVIPGYIGIDPAVDNNGVFAIYDSSAYADFSSVANNQFMARFAGGYRLRTNAAGTVGVDLAAGGSSWASVSSILTKDVVDDTINVDELVSRLNTVSFKIYKFKDDASNTNFLSTTAEEWHTLMSGFTTPEYAVNNSGNIPAIRTNDQISLALMLIQDIYRKLEEMSN
jgi:hypothetical protein